MGYVERLTKRVEPYAVELQPNWQQLFRPSRKADPELSDELLTSIEGWLTSHVVFVKMQRETLVATKQVRRAMERIVDQVERSNYNGAPDAAVAKLLKYRDEEDGVAARAHNVALDWIACGLPTARSLFGSSTKAAPSGAELHLMAAIASVDGMAQLRSSASGQLVHFNLDPVKQRERLQRLEGRRLPDGTIFAYKPDPRQRPHARPEQATRDILAAALRDIYKCTGSSPHVPRDGSQRSPFLRFLEAARRSLPRDCQAELVSPARRAEIDEKKNGPGTLERFKAKLYHPGCWRT
ncbi:MAG: hypothetical protein HC841_05830 [Verrucomicrobiae bacterium]|nr:hypothetical protein [Verrucomicrobiae bacterium]